MKKLILSIGTLLAIMVSTGCDNQSHGLDYRVKCTIDNTMRHDSATLLVLEDDYNQLRVCGAQRSTDGTFTFTGQTDRPKVALIRWDNDSTRPFYFVLESGDISITINHGSWHITGSAENSRYLHYINLRNSITDARVATWQEYLKMAADSSLKRDDEVRMVRQDSLLNDSLQRITVDCINRGDAVGRIVKQRYGQQLDQQHMRQLQ
ncbi:MAG: DUF4369 domain-containing protein [Muribaculaceae bacterium]|nr:DUF4369 domain-containing protein [Muribaculaceae bacterium]